MRNELCPDRGGFIGVGKANPKTQNGSGKNGGGNRHGHSKKKKRPKSWGKNPSGGKLRKTVLSTLQVGRGDRGEKKH